MTNPTRFGQPLDPALITNALAVATDAKARLAHLPEPISTPREIHIALRTMAGADTGVDALDNPTSDLADLIYALVRDYADALALLQTYATEPVEPAAEYERLIRAAEKEITTPTMRTDGAARAEALVKIADRWLSDAIVQAHKRRTAAGGSVTHFGSPAADPVDGSAPSRLDNEAAVWEYFDRECPEVAVVQDCNGALYLLTELEEGTYYLGIPQAENEEGTEVDPNKGRLDLTVPGGRAHPAFPLTVLGTGTTASYPRSAALSNA